MVRLIKRYGGGSRKLYDTEESRYISLDEIAAWVRTGQQLRVVDSKTGENVTAQTLAQVIYEGERRGLSLVPTEILHDVIHRSGQVIHQGGRAVQRGVERFQDGMDRLVRAGMDRVKPLQEARQEMAALRHRLEQLERSLGALEGNGSGDGRRGRRGRSRRGGRTRRSTKR
jgi:polyhydroxyalkanoate synthesis repressor PhaR